jgi:threonine synthase
MTAPVEIAEGTGAFRLGCVWCGAERPLDLRGTCSACGGTLEVRGGGRAEARRVSSLWDFARALPVRRRVSLGEGATPLVRLETLGAGDELYAKAEWRNPTGSFKDRGSTVAVSAALELGARGVVCASTGNNAASVSAYAARAGLPCLVVLPAGTSPAKIFQARLHGATIVEVEGTFSNAYDLAAAIAAADERWPNLTSTFLNPYMTAAHATIAYELVGELGRAPGTVVVPIGAGPMLVGIRDGFRRLADSFGPEPVLVGVQAAGCAPIARAWEAGADEVDAWPDEVASCAGSINDPLVGYAGDGTRTLRAIRASGGAAVAAGDEAILAALRDLGSREGIDCEPAAAATLAAVRLRDAVEPLPRPVVLVCSGHALKDTSVPFETDAIRVSANPDVAELLERAAERFGARDA